MNKYEVKKLFWKIVNEVEGCSDCITKNAVGVVIERGMLLSSGYSIMFGLDDGFLRIYDKCVKQVMKFNEESTELIALKELFEIELGE